MINRRRAGLEALGDGYLVLRDRASYSASRLKRVPAIVLALLLGVSGLLGAVETPPPAQPHLDVSPPELDFGSQIVGSTSVVRAITLSASDRLKVKIDSPDGDFEGGRSSVLYEDHLVDGHRHYTRYRGGKTSQCRVVCIGGSRVCPASPLSHRPRSRSLEHGGPSHAPSPAGANRRRDETRRGTTPDRGWSSSCGKRGNHSPSDERKAPYKGPQIHLDDSQPFPLDARRGAGRLELRT